MNLSSIEFFFNNGTLFPHKQTNTKTKQKKAEKKYCNLLVGDSE